jgi:hypothetical protein
MLARNWTTACTAPSTRLAGVSAICRSPSLPALILASTGQSGQEAGTLRPGTGYSASQGNEEFDSAALTKNHAGEIAKADAIRGLSSAIITLEGLRSEQR